MNAAAAPAADAAAVADGAVRRIDMHSHCFPRISRATASAVDAERAPWLQVDASSGKGHIMLGDKPFRPVLPSLWDPGVRLAEMDQQGIALQIVCATPVMFGYGWPAAKAADWAARMNDEVLDFCARAPGRFKALAQVPLQDTDRACREAERALADGCVGVQIGNHVGARDLDDEALVRFLVFCADKGIPLLVHPWDMMGGEAGRMKNWMLPWLVSMPAETQLSMLSLVLSGALERIPESLRICFAHGGGSFAWLLARADNAWRHRDVVRKDCPQLPSSYARRFFVDSAVFEPRNLAFLIEVMGADRIMLGSDYPFPLGEQQIGSLVHGFPGLTTIERTLIMHDNASSFFGLTS